MALVDAQADAEFLAELNRHNIQCVRYDARSGHANLWTTLTGFSGPAKDTDSADTDAFRYARKYFAAVLTRRRLASHMRPLKQAVAEGMILHMLQVAEEAGLSREELSSRLQEQLYISDSASSALVDSALQGLAADGLYRTDEAGTLRASKTVSKTPGLDESIALLVDGAVHRLVVREHGTDSATTRDLLHDYFEYLVLRRGWDVGAAYAAQRPPEAVVVEEVLKRLGAAKDAHAQPSKQLVRAVEGVLLNPSDAEVTVLAELGRLAFALELVRQAPQDTLFSSNVLPTRVYLDANVLMPATVEGHPFRSLYGDAMEKLLTATAASASGLEICVYSGFLNEVVSHRRLAQDEMSQYGARAADYIEREVRLYGAANMNVFVAGFARTLIKGQKLSFEQYLKNYAPYETEGELAAWLRNRGLRVVDTRQMQIASVSYPALLHHFEKVFAQEISDGRRNATLIAHDALQIAVLLGDVGRHDRAVLVTADRRLRDAVAWSEFPNLGSAMLSGVGLVQTIELLVGAVGDDRSVAQLLWSTRASSAAETVRRYLVDMALNQYDAALAMNMESIVSEITEDITFAIERDKGGRIVPDGNQLALSKYVEAFEPKFYEKMRTEQQRIRAKEQN